MKLFKKIKKGFTLVELVVVIAVIAILSAVSVAAYTGVTNKAKKSAAMQEARAAYMVWLAQQVSASKDPSSVNIDIIHETFTFNVTAGEFVGEGTDRDTSGDNFKNYNVTTGQEGLVEA